MPTHRVSDGQVIEMICVGASAAVTVHGVAGSAGVVLVITLPSPSVAAHSDAVGQAMSKRIAPGLITCRCHDDPTAGVVDTTAASLVTVAQKSTFGQLSSPGPP